MLLSKPSPADKSPYDAGPVLVGSRPASRVTSTSCIRRAARLTTERADPIRGPSSFPTRRSPGGNDAVVSVIIKSILPST